MSLSWHELYMCKVPEDPPLCVIGLILLMPLHLLLLSDLTAQIGGLPKYLKSRKFAIMQHWLYNGNILQLFVLRLFVSLLSQGLLLYTQQPMADDYLALMNCLPWTIR